MAFQQHATFEPVPRESVMTVMIPNVNLELDVEFIENIFEQLRLGCVWKVDLVYHSGSPNGNPSLPHNIAYVHFSGWNATGSSSAARDALEKGLELRVNYNPHSFWKVWQAKFIYRPPTQEYKLWRPTWSIVTPQD